MVVNYKQVKENTKFHEFLIQHAKRIYNITEINKVKNFIELVSYFRSDIRKFQSQ